MGKRDPRIDDYISNAAEFARPILKHLREVVHTACPEVEETMKWSHPFFLHKGILCTMAAFKQHCSFGFWRGSLVVEKAATQCGGMGQFGKIRSLADLPGDKMLAEYIRRAAQLNESGARPPVKQSKERTELVVPEDFQAALRKNKKALRAFENFSYSHKKEYLKWISEAKREETRQKRLVSAIQQIGEGKPRHWKHANCWRLDALRNDFYAIESAQASRRNCLFEAEGRPRSSSGKR